MARTTQITFSQVAQIADTMKAAGHRPTARALRERIGSGSMGTIHKLLQQYNGSASEEREVADLPDSIATALMDFLQTEVATACEPIQALLQESKEAAEALASENERLEDVIERLQVERDEAQRNQAVSASLHRREQIEHDECKAELTKTRELVSELRRDLDTRTRQVEMLASYQPELAATKEKLAESETNRFAAEKDAAVLTAQLEASRRQAIDLADRMKAAESQSRTKDDALRQANNHYQACSARLEEAARTIDELKKKNQPAATKVTKPKTTAAKPNELAKN